MRCLVLSVVVLLAASAVRADDFAIDVSAQAAKESKAVEAKYPQPDKKAQPRAVLKVAANTPIIVKWTARNLGKATVKDALVHFFVVKQEKLDQQEVPKLTKNVVVESALTMDFKTQDKTEGEITFTVRNPGCYLLRLEIKGAAVKGEPFAALDIVVR